jgi:hypothetical protein
VKRRAGTYLLRLATIALLVAAIAVDLTQPVKESADLAALVAIAGLLATVLSLALTVTLLVAQHTAERHAHALYAEFRRERAWLVALASLGVGVITIVAWSLLASTISTAWAALALAAALGLFAASLFPRLLDSLDRTELARRITDRIVDRLREVGGKTDVVHRESELKPIATRGIDIASGLAVEGISSNDREVVRAGFAGIRRVFIAYLEGSPTRGWDTEIVNYAFQHLEVATDLGIDRSPVLLLPVALEELTVLGVESPTVLRPVDQYENVSGRLNGLFLDVVARTLTADSSGAAAMATAGIGSSGVALIQAERPNGVTDHIRRLRSIAGAALRAERDHVAGQANHELARLALALAQLDSADIMPGSLYQDACDAISQSVDDFVARTTPAGSLMRDIAMTPINGPLATPNLSVVVVAGSMAHRRTRTRHVRDFSHGADALMHSLLRLARYRTSVVMTPSYALDTAYSAIVGALTLEPDVDLAEQVSRWWLDLVRQLIGPDAGGSINSPAMLTSLLLIGVYVAEEDRPHIGAKMREALSEALRLTLAITDDFDRRRASLTWLPAGRAAIGCGDNALATTISAGIAPDIRALRVAFAGGSWAEPDEFGPGGDFYAPVPGTPVRMMPAHHRRSEVAAEFRTLLDAAASVRSRRAPTRRRLPRTPK